MRVDWPLSYFLIEKPPTLRSAFASVPRAVAPRLWRGGEGGTVELATYSTPETVKCLGLRPGHSTTAQVVEDHFESLTYRFLD